MYFKFCYIKLLRVTSNTTISFFFETFPPVSKTSIYGKSRALRKNTRGEGISPGLEEPIYSVFQGAVFKLLSHRPGMTLIKISAREIQINPRSYLRKLVIYCTQV